MRLSTTFLLGALAGAHAVAIDRSSAAALDPRTIVSGNTFDRFVQIFLENQNYAAAIANSDLSYLASQGRLLTNYYAITHPSQPNYVAAVGGSTNGVTGDGDYNLASSIKSIVDLLGTGGISWAVYQEDMPYTGYTGSSYSAYRRKHNPIMSYTSVTGSSARLQQSKNFTLFNSELAAGTLPQWMFITPNMNNDGHDTGLAYGANWARTWLTPLLSNSNFNAARTLIILTYDEGLTSGTNQIYAVLLGSALSSAQIGSTDGTSYTHYSLMRTVEQNWGLGNLGKGDATANAFF